jgi:hypothetical protein
MGKIRPYKTVETKEQKGKIEVSGAFPECGKSFVKITNGRAN